MDNTALGGVIVIALIFIVYYITYMIEAKGKEKLVDQDVRKNMIDMELEKVRIQREELELKKGILAYETKKLGHNTIRAEHVEYKVLEDKKDRERKK
jgi:anaerobic ribonucleoside-triphosphate reductase